MFGLFRLFSLENDLNKLNSLISHLSSEIAKAPAEGLANKNNEEDILTMFNGKYCSQIENHFVEANFVGMEGGVVITWKSLDRKKVIGTHKAKLTKVMETVTVKTKDYLGGVQNYLLSKIEKQNNKVSSFYVGGGEFHPKNCQ